MNSLSQNVNGLLFLAGFALALWGLSAWSVPLAAVVAGVLVMVMAAAPYVRQRWTAAPFAASRPLGDPERPRR